jgi:hypothetical protein
MYRLAAWLAHASLASPAAGNGAESTKERSWFFLTQTQLRGSPNSDFSLMFRDEFLTERPDDPD